ncbi:hypothetical protein BV20DRAFT_957137 [Pilatotrama ljubarskyi]|nr:hypothetical protein BV20DRAFT_957137 [Pilatotrama ljubarskyi]
MVNQSKLPSYAFLSPEATQRQVEMTRKGTYALTPFETLWKARQPHLLERGYTLRPRYGRDWEPSWIGTNIDPDYCEDSIVLKKPYVMDARDRGGKLVAIKSLPNRGQEIEIAQFLSTLQRPENHCVRVLDVFPDPIDTTWSLMVMPFLRPFNDPEFEMVGDVIQFVSQMLEGLAFLHSNHVAHRDIAALNIMMDGRPLYPQGHHPVRRNCSEDIIDELAPLHRIDHPVKYFYVDFGLSVRFAPGASTLVVGDVGRDAEVPELSSTVPYDAYKADIYALGNLFDKEFQQQYHDMDFMKPLVECMKQRQPELRPPADELFNMFKQLMKLQNPSKARWRLSPKTETRRERLINDTVAAARDGFGHLRRFVG